MTYTISTAKPVDYSVCENDVQKSVLQNVALLISTKRGTVPMYRSFGLPMEFIGRPLHVAETIAASEVQDAITEYEKRVAVKDVALASDAVTGEMHLEVTIEI